MTHSPTRSICFVLLAGCSAGAASAPDAGDASVDASLLADRSTREAASLAEAAVIDSATDSAIDVLSQTARDSSSDAPLCCAPRANWFSASNSTPDQICPAWTLTDNAVADATFVGGAMRIATSGHGEKICYSHGGAELIAATHIFIRFRMQFVSGSSATTARGGAGVIFAFGPSRKKGSVFFEDGHVFLSAGEDTRGLTADVPTTDAMHDYQLEIDVGAGTMVLSQDSRALITGTLYTNPEDATDFIVWGEGSIVAQGVSLWESFSHTAYAGCD